MNTYSFRKDLLAVQEELLRFAYKLTADREEANDLLQETSLKALDNEDKYEPDTNFKGWMYTIMRNIFINNYRKIVREQTFVDQTDNLYHLSMPQDSGFASTEGAYDLKEMHRIVNSLPRDYKVPFSMHVSGFKYREIAERLGLPLGTVKSRIFFTILSFFPHKQHFFPFVAMESPCHPNSYKTKSYQNKNANDLPRQYQYYEY